MVPASTRQDMSRSTRLCMAIRPTGVQHVVLAGFIQFRDSSICVHQQAVSMSQCIELAGLLLTVTAPARTSTAVYTVVKDNFVILSEQCFVVICYAACVLAGNQDGC